MFSLNLKNNWSIFYLILLLNTLVLVLLTYGKYQDLKDKKYNDQSAIVKLLSHSFHSKLVENELLLDLLGNQLLENNRYLNKDKAQGLLKKMLETNPSLGGFGLVNPQGDFISLSKNIDIKKMKNLLDNKQTRDSFLRALQSDHLVVGKTYYIKAGNFWALPLRKALRDASGKVVAVMTTGFRVDNATFLEESDFIESRRITYINAHNHFYLYFSGLKLNEYKNVYSKPVNPTVMEWSKKSLKGNLEHTLSQTQTRRNTKPLFTQRDSSFFKTTIMESAIYDPDYEVWAMVSEPKSNLYWSLLANFSQYFLIYILSNLIIFGLIRSFNRYEMATRKKLLFQANHDPLTGLFNRNHLAQRFKTKEDINETIKVLFLDLDNFKNINDTFGHAIGDKLLVKVANRLQNFVSDSEQVIRFGGDEFVVLLFEDEPEVEIAQALINKVSESYVIEGMRFNVGASIGIAYALPQKHSLEKVLSHADIAMYQAKKRKNSVEIFSDELQQKLARKALIEQNLRNAMLKNEIYLAYQPQLKANKKIYGVEALVRWKNPRLGQIPPYEFIPIAEEIGIMPQLGKYIAQTALSEISALQHTLNCRFNLAINVSVSQFMEAGLCEELIQIIKASGMNPNQLTVEVTESLFIESLDRVLPMLQYLKDHQIKLSMDDFGTGFSSLSLLRKLPIHELKIDKMFVDDLLENMDKEGLIENIIDMAKKMGIYTVAEGIEQQSQAELLTQFGCDLYQGYLFAKPLVKADLEAFIQENQCDDEANP